MNFYGGDEVVLSKVVEFNDDEDGFKPIETGSVLLLSLKTIHAINPYYLVLVLTDENQWDVVTDAYKHEGKDSLVFISAKNGPSVIMSDKNEVYVGSYPEYKPYKELASNDYLETNPIALSSFGNIDSIQVSKALEEHVKKLNVKSGRVSYGREFSWIPDIIQTDFDFGWLVGIIAGSAKLGRHSVTIPTPPPDVAQKLSSVLDTKDIPFVETHKGFLINNRIFSSLIKYWFYSTDKEVSKAFNPVIIQFNKEFLKGLMSGVIDSSAAELLAGGHRVMISSKSREFMCQICLIARLFGYMCHETAPTYNEKVYEYHTIFSPWRAAELFTPVRLMDTGVLDYELDRPYFDYGERRVAVRTPLNLIDKSSYSISTSSGYFMCGNMIVFDHEERTEEKEEEEDVFQ